MNKFIILFAIIAFVSAGSGGNEETDCSTKDLHKSGFCMKETDSCYMLV